MNRFPKLNTYLHVVRQNGVTLTLWERVSPPTVDFTVVFITIKPSNTYFKLVNKVVSLLYVNVVDMPYSEWKFE
jgi:hypothetical protein